MSAEHTAGPWAAPNLEDECSSRQFWVLDEDGGLVAEVADEAPGGADVAASRARLIAAAPELLAACQNAVQFEQGTIWAKDMLAAIAKATGSTQ